MLITHVGLTNWRNFKQAQFSMGKRVYLIGANASGKSNLLDVFRFLREVSKASGGGLQSAVEARGGITKVRCLQARRDPEVRIQLQLSEDPDDPAPTWEYTLAFKADGKGEQRILVTQERVLHRGHKLFERPNDEDRRDPLRLTQTHLEQVNNNRDFRAIGEHLQATTYLHLVPQLLKHADEISGKLVEDDPFGQGLLQRIAKTPAKTRDARLKRIKQVLAQAVPQFSELEFRQDKVTGLPHLAACYQHWRPHGAWQLEDQFSDGTLRLIGLLWALQDGDGLLLLEEPELSLNDAIVGHIPLMVDRVLRKRGTGLRQVIVSTHSEALLKDVGEDASVLLMEPTADGTKVRAPDERESASIASGLSVSEVMLPLTRTQLVAQLGLFS
jgi:predicted ATPase